jgi:polysaccharide deacetylase family protein (PEP-CTERM system associated)
MINALCFDIDDLTYNLNIKKGTCLPQQYLVEQETLALLAALEELKIRATMFIPGYVAQRFPDLVRRIDKAGHEIGSHGFKHVTVDILQRKGFREDALSSKSVLEDIISKEVYLYKAPDWGITPRTIWAYDELVSAGYRADNSAQPSLLRSLGRCSDDMTPFIYKGSLTIIPVTSFRFMRCSIPFGGGLFCSYVPISIQIGHFTRLNQRGIPFNYYCHPFEFHPEGMNKHTWMYGSIRVALYGIYFGKYRDYISRLAELFKFAPLCAAYHNSMRYTYGLSGFSREAFV